MEFIFELRRKTGKKISLESGNEIINANDKLHWHVKHKLTAHLRMLGCEATQSEEYSIDKPLFHEANTCEVVIKISSPTNRRLDGPNLYPTVKALIDGMTDSGLWSDDNNNVIKRLSFETLDKNNKNIYELHIEIKNTEVV